MPSLPVIKIGPDGFHDVEGQVAGRYGQKGCFLIRPDQHIAASFDQVDATALQGALDKARALPQQQDHAA